MECTCKHDQSLQRQDFQFDLENVLTMSQLVGKSAEDRNAASVMLDILAGTKNKTAADVAVEIVTDAQKLSGQKVLYAVLAANIAGRAKVIVREDDKEWCMGLGQAAREFGRDSGATSITTDVFQYSWPSENPFEDVWREWVKNVSELPQGSLSSQASEQLTISGLSRHGRSEREPLQVESTGGMARRSVSGRNISPQPSTVTTTSRRQRCVDRCKVPELWKPDTSKKRLLVSR